MLTATAVTDIDAILDPMGRRASEQRAAVDACDRALEILDAKWPRLAASIWRRDWPRSSHDLGPGLTSTYVDGTLTIQSGRTPRC